MISLEPESGFAAEAVALTSSSTVPEGSDNNDEAGGKDLHSDDEDDGDDKDDEDDEYSGQRLIQYMTK